MINDKISEASGGYLRSKQQERQSRAVSSVVERVSDKDEVIGSIPIPPTFYIANLLTTFCIAGKSCVVKTSTSG